jgi:hypothetical protein
MESCERRNDYLHPRKHHYIPVFYLKQWASTADKRLCEHKLIPGRGVKPRRTSPDGTGYQVDLYRVQGVPEAIAHDLENKFMRLVDSDASRALEKIISSDISNWPGNLRSGWTRLDGDRFEQIIHSTPNI